MRFDKSTAKDIINAFGAFLERVASVSGEVDDSKGRVKLSLLATSLWAIDELLHVPAIKATIINTSLFNSGMFKPSCSGSIRT